MLLEKLNGLRVLLEDNNNYQIISFHNNTVTATIGEKGGPLCAPILNLFKNSESSITLSGDNLNICWESIEILNDKILTVQNGKKTIYNIITNEN